MSSPGTVADVIANIPAESTGVSADNEPEQVELHDSVIRLGQFLKLANLCDSGADAKDAIAGGSVQVNGEVETRRARQLTHGDVVVVGKRSAQVSSNAH